MDVVADVAFVRSNRRPRVDPDADPDRPGIQASTAFPRGLEGTIRRGEREEERVALCVDLHSTVPRERIAQHPPVLGQHLRVRVLAEPMEELRRTLYIREQERHGPVWQIGPHGATVAAHDARRNRRASVQSRELGL